MGKFNIVPTHVRTKKDAVIYGFTQGLCLAAILIGIAGLIKSSL
jgi:hypothetical protein